MAIEDREKQAPVAVCREKCKLTGTEHEQLIEEIVAIAKAEGRFEVMDSFRESVLRNFVCIRHSVMSVKEMFIFLKDAVDCREELHELERTMDKKHFVELITGGYLMAGGVDKKSNLPIFWIRSGLLDRNSWNYTHGSPRANAYVRCVLYDLVDICACSKKR